MPIIRKSEVPVDSPKMPDALGSFAAALYSDAGGLTQFGAFTETLPPGSRSSLKHWHETEDEFILVIAGTWKSGMRLAFKLAPRLVTASNTRAKLM